MERNTRTLMKLEKASDAWLKNCVAIGRSKDTIANYRSVMGIFRNWLDESDEFRSEKISFLTIQAFRNEMIATKKASTVSQYLEVLTIFFNWASDEKMGDYRFYTQNPVATSLFPDVSREQKRPYDLLMSDDEVKLLYRNKPARNMTKFTWPRNYAIIILLMTTGIRISELIRLRLCDVNLDEMELTVERGKGSKFRVIDFPHIAKTALEIYLQSGLRPAWLKEEDYLFGTIGRDLTHEIFQKFSCETPQCEWKCYTRQALHLLVRAHVYNVTGVPDIGPHDLRHICARVDLNSGMRIEELQSKLGHSNPETTQIYSGRLMARRSRKSAESIIEAQEHYAKLNEQKIAISGAAAT